VLDDVRNRLSRSIARTLLKTVPISDDWSRRACDIPTELYGLGSKHEFEWYLEGDSDLTVTSIEEMEAWLNSCQYVRDPELFHEADFWQHPCTFERLRAGDCEDFALWSWRLLIRLGYPAEFVAGRSRTGNAEENQGGESTNDCWRTGHTWVHYEYDGEQWLFDAVASLRNTGNGTRACARLEDIRHRYLPEVSIDENMVRYVYGGYYSLAGLNESKPDCSGG